MKRQHKITFKKRVDGRYLACLEYVNDLDVKCLTFRVRDTKEESIEALNNYIKGLPGN